MKYQDITLANGTSRSVTTLAMSFRQFQTFSILSANIRPSAENNSGMFRCEKISTTASNPTRFNNQTTMSTATIRRRSLYRLARVKFMIKIIVEHCRSYT